MNVRKHLSTIVISLSIGLLMGGGGAYAASSIISGHQIKAGTIGEVRLSPALRAKINQAVTDEDVFRSVSQLQVEISRAARQVYTEVNEEFVRKPLHH